MDRKRVSLPKRPLHTEAIFPTYGYTILGTWAVDGAQLAEWSLPTLEDPSSNPAICSFYIEHVLHKQ